MPNIVILEHQNAHQHIIELEEARMIIQEAYNGFYHVMKLLSDSLPLSGKDKRYIDPHENGLEDIHSDILVLMDNEIKNISDVL